MCAYKRISPQPVVEGGTGALTLTGVLTGNGTSAITANAVTQYGTVVAGASNAVSSIAPSATTGVPYISQGAASNPVFGTAVVAGGGTGLTSATAYAVLCGGTTSTGALQSIAGVGTSGQVLTSNGAGALPTFQAGSGGGILTTTVAVSSTEIKSLVATPKTLIAAQGSGKLVNVINIAMKMTYGGSNVFVAAAAQTLQLRYIDGSGTFLGIVFSNAAIVASANRTAFGGLGIFNGIASTLVENAAIVLTNSTATEISGNAANDNTFNVELTYQVLTL